MVRLRTVPVNAFAHWVLVDDVVPWIGLRLLHTQRDFLLVFVDAQHHDVDFVTNRHQFAGVIDAAGPRHLADVHQTFDTVFQFDKGTVRQHVDDFAFDDGVDRVLLADVVPGALGLLLEAQSDFLFLVVDVQDHHFDLIVDLHHLRRMVDASPTHVRDVQQTVDTAQVNKRTEIGDVLDEAFSQVAHRQDFEQSFLFFLASVFDQATARHNDVASGFVDLQDHALDFLADVVRDVGRTADIHLTGGQEHVDAILDDVLAVHLATNGHQQTTFDLANNRSANHVAFRMRLDDFFPVANTTGFFHRQDDQTDAVFKFFQQHFNLRAGLGKDFAVFPLFSLNDPFALVSDVNNDFFVVDAYDSSGQDVVDVVGLRFGGKHFAEHVLVESHQRFEL